MQKKERILKAIAVILIVGLSYTANSIMQYPQFYSNLYNYSFNDKDTESSEKPFYAAPLKLLSKSIRYISNN